MKTRLVATCAGLLVCAASLVAQSPAPLAALARMPVKEATVFKDGHAFVLHEGTLPTDAAGNVLMDYLPAPVLGTFWPYSSNRDVKLAGVVAGQRRMLVEETALSLAALLEGNAGAQAIITEKTNAVRYACGSYMAAGDRPSWWRWYSWPNWWAHFNGVGRVTWKIRIEPGKSADLGYTWHYFWR